MYTFSCSNCLAANSLWSTCFNSPQSPPLLNISTERKPHRDSRAEQSGGWPRDSSEHNEHEEHGNRDRRHGRTLSRCAQCCLGIAEPVKLGGIDLSFGKH